MSESRHTMTRRYPARSARGPATPGGALAICRSRLMRAAVAGLILFLFAAACSTAGAQGTRAECEAAGGKWGRFGLRQQELCDLPAPDAGKACTDSRDCASACVAPDAAPVASSAEGKCYGRMLLLGTCLKQVRGGVVALPLCAD
jgi:hypothetical protein